MYLTEELSCLEKDRQDPREFYRGEKNLFVSRLIHHQIIKEFGPGPALRPRQYSILSKFPRCSSLHYAALSLSVSRRAPRRGNTEIVYPRRDLGRGGRMERDSGRRQKEEEGELGRETTENTSGSYELQWKTVDYVCLTLPGPSARPHRPSFRSLPLAPPSALRSPSRKRASESLRVMFEHEK